MGHRRKLEIHSDSHNTQKWRVSLSEDNFQSFIKRATDTAREVFRDGSLFNPLLFGKFFDPADAFPLWEFESDVLISGLRNVSKSSVDWLETEKAFVLRAELPGSGPCEVEICLEKGKILEISGQWTGKDSETRDWQATRWWENGYVRRIELPENANWVKTEAYLEDDIFLEIKLPKLIAESQLEP